MKDNKNIDLGVKELEGKIGYIFVNKDLILEALSHPSLNKQIPNKQNLDSQILGKQTPNKQGHPDKSFSEKNKSSNPQQLNYQNSSTNYQFNYQFNYQRLEFLGDSVLNFAVTSFLVNKFNYNEGLLAKLRSYLISKNTIVEVAKKFDIGRFIIMATGEEKTGGRENINNIENAMEAIIGAICMDSSIEAALGFVNKYWNEYYLKCSSEIDDFDPKSKLQEIFQSKKMGRPEYLIYSHSDKITHDQTFSAELNFGGKKFVGSGKNKKDAQKNCARAALDYINKAY
jgi:ribonuclease III